MLLVYGGSFSPPTIAHEEIASYLINKYKCNLVFVPVGNSYKKDNLIEFHHRYNMIKIIANKLNATVSDYENKEEFSGTFDLLNELSKVDKDIYFVLGADNLINIKTWFNYEELINKYKFIVLTRNNIKIDLLNNNFIIENINLNISSSNYRETKNNNIINKDVLKYIKENNLY